MQKETTEALNRFLQFLFNGNAVIDNICYNLKYKNYARLENAMHGPVAHIMGSWADEVSDMMDMLGARPVRYALPENAEELTPEEGYQKLADYFAGLRDITVKAMGVAEEEGEFEVKLFLEDFLLNKVMRYRKQAEQWLAAVKEIGADSLNVHIDDYTSYLG